MKKRIIALGMAIIMVLGFSTVVYGDDNIATVKADADGKLVAENVSLDTFDGMAPGDKRTEMIVVKNESEDVQYFYVLQKTLTSLEESNQTAGGAYTFDVRVGEAYDSAASLLSKKVGGYDSNGNAREDGLKDVTELSENDVTSDGYTMFASLKPGETTNLYINISINGEGNDINYANAIGEMELGFKVNTIERRPENKVIPRLKTIVKNKIIKRYVKTGDSYMLFVYGGMLVAGIAVVVIAFKRRKKEEA